MTSGRFKKPKRFCKKCKKDISSELKLHENGKRELCKECYAQYRKELKRNWIQITRYSRILQVGLIIIEEVNEHEHKHGKTGFRIAEANNSAE